MKKIESEIDVNELCHFTHPTDRKNYSWKLKTEKTFHSAHTPNLDEAKIYALNQILGKKEKQIYVTFKDFTKDMFLVDKCPIIKSKMKKGKTISVRNYEEKRSRLVNHILPQFGHRLLSSIEEYEIEEWLDDLDFSASTKNHILSDFRAIYKYASKKKCNVNKVVLTDIRYDPPEGSLPRIPIPKDKLDLLFPESLEGLLDVWGNLMRVAYFIALSYTGARNGEIRALKWSDINFEENYIDLNKSLNGKNIPKPNTKNGECRYVPLFPYFREILLAFKEESLFNSTGDYVFTCNGEKPFWPIVYYSQWKKVKARFKISDNQGKVVPHSFRHSFVSMANESNIDKRIVKQIVGHKSEAMRKHYDKSDRSVEIPFLKDDWEAAEIMFEKKELK